MFIQSYADSHLTSCSDELMFNAFLQRVTCQQRFKHIIYSEGVSIFICYPTQELWKYKSWTYTIDKWQCYGPLARHVTLRVAHAPGMPGRFSPPSRVSYPDMHHCTCMTHVPWYMPGSLNSGSLYFRSRGKHSRHSGHMCNPQFYVSSKRSFHHHSISNSNV